MSDSDSRYQQPAPEGLRALTFFCITLAAVIYFLGPYVNSTKGLDKEQAFSSCYEVCNNNAGLIIDTLRNKGCLADFGAYDTIKEAITMICHSDCAKKFDIEG